MTAEPRDPTEATFHRLLAWLDEGADSGGARYLEMRRRLIGYFDRKLCDLSDALADETLNRVARRLDEEGAIEGVVPAQYCYIVARFVFHEHLRDMSRKTAAVAELRSRARTGADLTDATEAEARLACLDRCLAALEAPDRSLILNYYRAEPSQRIAARRQLAANTGLSANALMIRASRLRSRLERCVSECCLDDRQMAVSS